MPTIGSSKQILRTASSNSLLVIPPGSGVPVPGAIPGSTTSISTDKNTPSQPSVRIANDSSKTAFMPR